VHLGGGGHATQLGTTFTLELLRQLQVLLQQTKQVCT
jgi:hypothetical protein